MIPAHARTGSTLLSRALNSHPRILCFGELFNWLDRHSVDFFLAGYDNWNTADVAMRNTNPVAFLRERIYRQTPEMTSAVGFKLHYSHCAPPWGFPSLLDYLVQEKDVRIVHLQRRNMLKSLASHKLAARTGEYRRIRILTRLSRIPKAFIHPARAFKTATAPAVRNFRRGGMASRVTLSAEECVMYFKETRSEVARHEELFKEHNKPSLFYEDVLSSCDEVFARAQSFLGVEPRPLTIALRKQNPDDLRALIENYDELREAFAETEYGEFFL